MSNSILQREKAHLEDFRYDLPADRIAKYPAEPRDQSKLMVLHRKTDIIEHRIFREVPEYFNKGDVLVLNQTRVFPARLVARKEQTGAKVEVFLLRELGENVWEVLVKPARKVRVGNNLIISDHLVCEVIDNTISGGRVVQFYYEGEDFYDIIEKVGEAPLPPYIKRSAEPKDKQTYQTVYAQEPGAVAAPTAGLHFTDDLLEKIQATGVQIVTVTLHIGLGTFRPVTSGDLSRHAMHSEYFRISPESAEIINSARGRGNKICAVGTSAVRVLETSHMTGENVIANEGWTDLFIYPPYRFKVVDAMITNFHQPESTLIMLVSAFYNTERVLQAYQEALDNDYRFLSYGDAMLIL